MIDERTDDEGRRGIPADWPDAAAGTEAQKDDVKNPDPDRHDETSDPQETADEASEDSFPASDPPAW